MQKDPLPDALFPDNEEGTKGSGAFLDKARGTGGSFGDRSKERSEAMDIEKLIEKIDNAEYPRKYIDGHGTYPSPVVDRDTEARLKLRKVIYEWAAEEITDIDAGKRIAELEAKCYTYEKVIANSNFAPIADSLLGYCQKIYNLDTPEEVAIKIMKIKAGSVAEIISELQTLEGGMI